MKYRTIVADPPWPYDDGWPGWGMTREERRALPYPAMTLDEIRALPVATLAEPEAYLFLWTTTRYLGDALQVLHSWHFTYRQTIVWCKEPMGQGPGGMFATNLEFILIAQRIGPCSHARGKRTNGVRIATSWFNWSRREHSAKPEAFIDLVEQVSPGPYVELFARRQRLGWDTWGNECFNTAQLEAPL